VVSSLLSLLRCRERVAFKTLSLGCVSPWSSSCVFKLQPNDIQVHTTFTGGISEYNFGVFSMAINIYLLYCKLRSDPRCDTRLCDHCKWTVAYPVTAHWLDRLSRDVTGQQLAHGDMLCHLGVGLFKYDYNTFFAILYCNRIILSMPHSILYSISNVIVSYAIHINI
jgi:hypothetical protein